MIKAFLRARWMVWLSLLILLVASLLANWLINASLEVALNSWFFALIPLLVIGGCDFWRFRREWSQLQGDVTLLAADQISDPLGRFIFKKSKCCNRPYVKIMTRIVIRNEKRSIPCNCGPIKLKHR